MLMTLTPDQQAIVRQAVADGVASSAEDFISLALQRMQDDLTFDLEDRLGMSVEQIDREIEKGLRGAVMPWEGADSFHARMLYTYGDVRLDDPQK